MRILVCVWALMACAGPSFAQEPASPPQPVDPVSAQTAALFTRGASEWMVTAGNAWGFVVFHSARGHDFALQTLSWGKILTAPRGSGAWRGRFQWAVEAMPLYGQYRPNRVYGFGVSPLVWRWNFEPRGRLAPYGELAGGLLFTTDPVPMQTTSVNFTAHAGAGFRYFLRPQQALVFTYRFHHSSNGNRLERNPGVNAHALQVGWSLVRPGP